MSKKIFKQREGKRIMRLVVDLVPNQTLEYRALNQYWIHSFIWDVLKDTKYSTLHDVKGFKFFSFSSIFPINKNIEEGKKYHLIISSPSHDLIKVLKSNFSELAFFGNYSFKIVGKRLVKPKLKPVWQTSTPIVLYKDNKKNQYIKITKGDVRLFSERLVDNALKKYKAFFLEDIEIENLFESYVFRKQVAVKLEKRGSEFIIIGSHWKFNVPKIAFSDEQLKRFYLFLYDCGLGEKNSLGFGFVN